MASGAKRTKLLAITGPTAGGKSALALRIAREFDGEIIAADSWTVYRGFDVGTAKPGPKELKEVPHHLLDVREAEQGFNAPLFQRLANAAIADIQGRGKLPILVGGTGLYIDSVLYDFGFLDSISDHRREDLDAMELDDLLALAKSEKIDLTDIDTRNKRRVIRAVEAGGQKPTRAKLRPGTLLVGLQPEAAELNARIEQRVDKMLAAGLEAEVKLLAAKYSWDIEPMKGIGYREWQDYFAGIQDLERTRQRIISDTRNLAKRQRTWLKRNPQIKWFSTNEAAYGFIKTQLLNT